MAENNVFGALYDVAMTDDGDLMVENGDLKQVSGSDWFIQEVNKIIRTNNPDWQTHPNVGAGLEDFIGENNTRVVGKAIEDRLHEKITAESIHYPGELIVSVVPTSVDGVYIDIRLLVDGDVINVSKIIFDFADGSYRSTTGEPDAVSDSVTAIPPNVNPYLSRIK